MTEFKAMRDRIISLLPSESLKAEIKKRDHIFSETDLARIIIDCAPSIEQESILLEEYSRLVKDKSFGEYLYSIALSKRSEDAVERDPGCDSRCLRGEVCINHYEVKFPAVAQKGGVISFPDGDGCRRLGIVLYDPGEVCDAYCVIPVDSDAVKEREYENEFRRHIYIYPPFAETVTWESIDPETEKNIKLFTEFWDSVS